MCKKEPTFFFTKCKFDDRTGVTAAQPWICRETRLQEEQGEIWAQTSFESTCSLLQPFSKLQKNEEKQESAQPQLQVASPM